LARRVRDPPCASRRRISTEVAERQELPRQLQFGCTRMRDDACSLLSHPIEKIKPGAETVNSYTAHREHGSRRVMMTLFAPPDFESFPSIG